MPWRNTWPRRARGGGGVRRSVGRRRRRRRSTVTTTRRSFVRSFVGERGGATRESSSLWLAAARTYYGSKYARRIIRVCGESRAAACAPHDRGDAAHMPSRAVSSSSMCRLLGGGGGAAALERCIVVVKRPDPLCGTLSSSLLCALLGGGVAAALERYVVVVKRPDPLCDTLSSSLLCALLGGGVAALEGEDHRGVQRRWLALSVCRAL